MSKEPGKAGSKTGRPRKGEPPKLPYDELDQVLVFGEVVKAGEGEGEGTTTVYPSYRELGRRYGVSHSLIAQYSRKHDCLRRRKEAKARIMAKASRELVEMRAKAIALSKDDALRIIDTYLSGFEEALAEGRVRYDNPTDFNTMLRLKEFILGGADSRQEIHAALSLEDIQARHQRMLKTMQASSAAEQGVVDRTQGGSVDPSRQLPQHSPAPPTEAAPQEVTVQQVDKQVDKQAPERPQAPHGGPSRARSGSLEDRPTPGRSAPHGPNVAPVGPGVAELGDAP